MPPPSVPFFSRAAATAADDALDAVRRRTVEQRRDRLGQLVASVHEGPRLASLRRVLAVSDVHYLSEALAAHYAGDPEPLAGYSTTALRRVWSSVRFSWWMTTLLHRFPDQTAFDQRAQEEDLAYLAASQAAQTSVAEQYAGLDL